MDKALKQRLVGATVLIIFAVIVLPMLLSGRSDRLSTESRQIDLPAKPEELSFETRRFPIGVPDKAPPPVSQPAPAEDGAQEGAAPLPGVDEVKAGDDAASEAESLAGIPEDNVEKPPAVTTVIIAPAEETAVEPETVSEPEPEITPAPASLAQDHARYLVQVASFSSEKRANAMAAELRKEKLPVVMDVVDRTAGRLHRVRVGPYAGRTEADAVVTQIRDMNKDLSPRIVDTKPDESAPVSAPSDPLVRWVVQVGSFSSPETAESEVAKLRLTGLTAFSEKVTSAGGTTYKVRVGPEIDRARAVQLAKDIKAQHNIDGFVTTQD